MDKLPTMKKALLLINVGTPDKPEKPQVKKYLKEFLNDPLVIDLPWLWRNILVNGIIIPFRVKKSTGLYRQVWTERGSPLLFHTNDLKAKLEKNLAHSHDVFIAMRYGNPGLPEVMSLIEKGGYEQLQILPMYPHYACATTGTSLMKAEEIIAAWKAKPTVQTIKQFYDNPLFLDAFIKNIQRSPYNQVDHVIFSYHGLPVRQINKMHPDIKECDCNCSTSMPEHGKMCYKATCFHTSRLLMERLRLDSEKCTTAFQSRLTKNWLLPTTEEVILDKAKNGAKKIMVIAPAFTTDCLETVVEIGIEYRELFLENGGSEFFWVESLNSEEHWVEAIERMVSC